MLLVFIRNHFYEKWKPIRLTNIVFVCQGGILVQNLRTNLNVAKAGGLQSQGVKGEAVVGYRKSLTTQDLKSSGFPGG